MGVGWVVAKAKKRSKMTQVVEFRVAMICTCTYVQRADIPLQGLDRRGPIVGAISNPYY